MKIWLVIFLVITTSAFAADDPNDFGDERSVTVLASSSMTLPLAELAKAYSKQNNIDVNTVYEATPELLEKIKAGDPADVVITPNLKYLESMKQQGLIEADSVKYIVGNSLSLVAAKEFKIDLGDGNIKNILIKIRNKSLMIIGNIETTSLGNYTKQALEKLGLWQSFAKFTIPGPTSAKTADLIIKSQTAGIVFTSDYMLYQDQLNNLGLIPENTHEPVKYYGAVVVSDNMDKARSFLKYLGTEPAKDIFKLDGFTVK